MQYVNKVANLQDYVLSNAYENIEMIVYTTISFFLPLLIGHPQIVVGIVVNSLLISGALNVRGYKLLPIIIAPALGAISRGILFGPFTVFLLYHKIWKYAILNNQGFTEHLNIKHCFIIPNIFCKKYL